ncbi:Nonribosomal peptide synthetase [Dirofilaria immitis]
MYKVMAEVKSQSMNLCVTVTTSVNIFPCHPLEITLAILSPKFYNSAFNLIKLINHDDVLNEAYTGQDGYFFVSGTTVVDLVRLNQF